MYYLYVLTNKEDGVYIGSTRDLKRRIARHQAGHVQTTSGNKWKLVYYEAYRAESDARQREKRLKQHGQAKRQLKDRIVASRKAS